MEQRKACFFCCESPNYGDDETEESNSHPSKLLGTKSSIKSKPFRQFILQISQYLKVPQIQLNQLKHKEDDNNPVIIFCEDCEEISEHLSVLCRNLEITKMKIGHYLNLLTDRIIGINNEDTNDDDDDDQRQLNNKGIQLSDLQKTVHQKCLLKARKFQDKAIPQVRLTKCHDPSLEPQPQFITDDTEEDHTPYVLEADNNNIKIELSADDNPEVHPCPFCTFTVTCGDQLQNHINNQHSEQFESYTTVHSKSEITSSDDVNLSDDIAPYQANYTCDFCPLSFVKISNKTSHMEAIHSSSIKPKRRVNKCNICGAMVGSTNLAQHKRVHHRKILLSEGQDAHKYQTKCEFCPLTFTNAYNKERHVNGTHHHSQQQSSNQLDGGKVKLTGCDICGAIVSTKNLSGHKKTRHRDVLGIIGEVGRRKPKKFKCDVCGIRYAVKSSLWRHLKENKKCSKGMKKSNKQMVNEISEPNEIRKGAKMDVEDPLQI